LPGRSSLSSLPRSSPSTWDGTARRTATGAPACGEAVLTGQGLSSLRTRAAGERVRARRATCRTCRRADADASAARRHPARQAAGDAKLDPTSVDERVAALLRTARRARALDRPRPAPRGRARSASSPASAAGPRWPCAHTPGIRKIISASGHSGRDAGRRRGARARAALRFERAIRRASGMNRRRTYADDEKAKRTAAHQKMRYRRRTGSFYGRHYWTSADDGLVLAHALPDRVLAERLGVSVSAIQARRTTSSAARNDLEVVRANTPGRPSRRPQVAGSATTQKRRSLPGASAAEREGRR
jgi:hypothetical protein